LAGRVVVVVAVLIVVARVVIIPVVIAWIVIVIRGTVTAVVVAGLIAPIITIIPVISIVSITVPVRHRAYGSVTSCGADAGYGLRLDEVDALSVRLHLLLRDSHCVRVECRVTREG